eukprot:1080321-Prorocentrum_minimum.AAC.1
MLPAARALTTVGHREDAVVPDTFVDKGLRSPRGANYWSRGAKYWSRGANYWSRGANYWSR